MTIDEAIKILEPYTGPEYQGIKFRTACEVAVSSLRAQKDTPPNDTLTLEQLREMDGEPVWICWDERANACWALVTVVSKKYDLISLTHLDANSNFARHNLKSDFLEDLLNESAKIYRRKPEAVTI